MWSSGKEVFEVLMKNLRCWYSSPEALTHTRKHTVLLIFHNMKCILLFNSHASQGAVCTAAGPNDDAHAIIVVV